MKIQAKALLVAFALSLVLGVLSHRQEYLTAIYTETEAIATANLLVGILSLMVCPLLIFACFFVIGRRIETIKEFYSYLLSIFLGNWIGLAIGTFVSLMFLQLGSSLPPDFVFFMFLGSIAGSLFSHSFFVGFSALASAT